MRSGDRSRPVGVRQRLAKRSRRLSGLRACLARYDDAFGENPGFDSWEEILVEQRTHLRCGDFDDRLCGVGFRHDRNRASASRLPR